MKILFSLILTLLSFGIYSQSDSLSKYFDDGNISNSKNIIKINPTSLIAADLPLHFERVISPTLSLELGLGLILDMPIYELIVPGNIPQRDMGSGFSLWVNPRIYLGDKAPEGYFFGFLYRRREYSSGYIYNDFVLNNGFQFSFTGGRMMFEMMYGCGIRFLNKPIETSSYNFLKVNFIAPVSIKLGYKF